MSLRRVKKLNTTIHQRRWDDMARENQNHCSCWIAHLNIRWRIGRCNQPPPDPAKLPHHNLIQTLLDL